MEKTVKFLYPVIPFVILCRKQKSERTVYLQTIAERNVTTAVVHCSNYS